MSAGIYNYLSFESFPEVINRINDMKEIQLRLIELGADDVARDVGALVELCDRARNQIEPVWEKLNDVFYNVEWFGTRNVGEESLQTALERYRRC